MHHHSVALIALVGGVLVGYLLAAQIANFAPNLVNKVVL